MNIDQFLADADKQTSEFLQSDNELVLRCRMYDERFQQELLRPTGRNSIHLKYFFARAHSAYLGTVRMCFSTQLPEPYMTMRAMIENAAYAYLLATDRAMYKVWLDRQDMQTIRQRFQVKTILRTLDDAHAGLKTRLQDHYEETISRGAHPNPEGMKRTMTHHHDGENKRHNLVIEYFSGHGEEFEECLDLLFSITEDVLKLFELALEVVANRQSPLNESIR